MMSLLVPPALLPLTPLFSYCFVVGFAVDADDDDDDDGDDDEDDDGDADGDCPL